MKFWRNGNDQYFISRMFCWRKSSAFLERSFRGMRFVRTTKEYRYFAHSHSTSFASAYLVYVSSKTASAYHQHISLSMLYSGRRLPISTSVCANAFTHGLRSASRWLKSSDNKGSGILCLSISCSRSGSQSQFKKTQSPGSCLSVAPRKRWPVPQSSTTNWMYSWDSGEVRALTHVIETSLRCSNS